MEEKVNSIIKELKDINYYEWQIIKGAIDKYFEFKVKKAKRDISLNDLDTLNGFIKNETDFTL